MKGHIAFCPHFHQPHFQLYKTREEAFKNSYLSWLKLLKEAVNIDSFYINLHLSGPLLYWLRDQKPDYIQNFKKLLTSNKIGLIGGLADEPFVQLSSRSDDFLYQLKKYDELLYESTGVKAENWQGIHVVERECGELTLKELTYAAKLLKAPAIFYLDAETFFESHFNYPGSNYDYCVKHFGFVDPVAKTTISHIPQNFLYYAFRDEIAGQEFFALPVHSQFRYQLLKRQSFTQEDRVKIKPAHYYFYVKDALENAARFAEINGQSIPPVLVIFEDAEKLGQWSKDPQGDIEWLLEFFELVAADEELEFIGLKDYIDRYGYIDTYPVTLSHSYPEWENWTAKRGIRGVTYGDERLRRVICRLRDFEAKQEQFESQVLNSLNEKLAGLDADIKDIINRSVFNSPERYELVAKILKDEPDKLGLYEIINRIRNAVYQEDPKWASRHPSYGSSPYYDVTGLAYLEIAFKVLKSMLGEDLSQPVYRKEDWDYDGQDEILIENKYQTVVIDTKGGCISYHNVIRPSVADDLEKMTEILIQDSQLPAYNSIYRHAYPIVFTEADSEMAVKFYEEGGRKEVSRNAFRCQVLVKDGDVFEILGDFDTAQYKILSLSEQDEGIEIILSREKKVELNNKTIGLTLTKTFLVGEQNIKCKFELKKPDDITVYLAPQIVSSAAASDEVEFKPLSFLGIAGTSGELEFTVQDVSVISPEGIGYKSFSSNIKCPETIDYLYQIKSANGSRFWNCLSYGLGTADLIESVYVRPAVREYYKNYVFTNQSSLGYHTSGILISPIITAAGNKITLEVTASWELDTRKDKKDYQQVINLIE